MENKSITFPEKIYNVLFGKENYRYVVFYGGRGSAKSWSVANYLLIKSLQSKVRILCAREYQSSISSSSYKLLVDCIERDNFSKYFTITRDSIRAYNGSEFLFKGISLHTEEIKSTEGVDYCWVEEAEKVTEIGWDIICPTIRKENSKIIITFNPEDEENATYKRFVINQSKDTKTTKVNFYDNPFFPEVLKKEMEYDKEYNFEKYLWKWEGNPRLVNDAVIYKNKWEEREFEAPQGTRFLFGIDWGFALDPTTLVRCFINDNYLYVDYEAYGVGVDLDETPALFDKLPEVRRYILKADCARPETISFMNKQRFNIKPAKKWKGSVEDGIEYIKSFKKIIVHPRCKHTIEELKTYSYKRDKNNGDILPIIIDKDNHCMDALRYALDGYITSRFTVADML